MIDAFIIGGMFLVLAGIGFWMDRKAHKKGRYVSSADAGERFDGQQW